MHKDILIIDSNKELNNIYISILKKNEFIIKQALTGDEALTKINSKIFDLIILEPMLPDINGIVVLDAIKNSKVNKLTPVIILTEYMHEANESYMLKNGATDFIVKGISLEVLLIRVNKALLSKSTTNTSIFISQKLQVCLNSRQAICNGIKIYFTTKEEGIVYLLISDKHKIWTYDEIAENVWKYSSIPPSDETIQQHANRVRKKIQQADPRGRYIINHSKRGYSME